MRAPTVRFLLRKTRIIQKNKENTFAPKKSMYKNYLVFLMVRPSLKISITNQPEKYQVANYNIYPAPQLQIDSAYTSSLTVSTQLCVRETALPVPG